MFYARSQETGKAATEPVSVTETRDNPHNIVGILQKLESEPRKKSDGHEHKHKHTLEPLKVEGAHKKYDQESAHEKREWHPLVSKKDSTIAPTN